MRLTICVVILASVTMLGRAEKPKDEGWSELLPPGEGRTQVLESCTTCHNLKVTVQERKSRTAWTKTVNDMIIRGAPLFPEEVEPIISYLSTVFAPGVPKPININTATREELEKLPGMKADLAARLLEARRKSGPFENATQLRQALGKQSEDFDKIRHLLKYKN